MGALLYPPVQPETDSYSEYRIGLSAVELKEMCEKYPTVNTAWMQFKTVLKLCESERQTGYKGHMSGDNAAYYAPYIPISYK